MLSTLSSPGTALANEGVQAHKAVSGLLVYNYQLATNVLLCLGLVGRHGFKWVVPAGSRIPRLRRRYARSAYAPWGDGLLWRYFVLACVGIFISLSFLIPVAILVERKLPSGIATVLGWSSSAWVALWQGAQELRQQFRWVKLIVPFAGLIQLAGVCVTVLTTLRRESTMFQTDRFTIVQAAVLAMLAGSFAAAGMTLYLPRLRSREEECIPRRAGVPVAEIRPMIAGRIMLYPSVIRLCICLPALGLLVGSLDGPRTASLESLLKGAAMLTAACVGNRMISRGFVDGEVDIKGIAVTAALGVGFLVDWVVLEIPPSWMQGLGSLITVIGALIMALKFDGVRADLARRLRFRRR